MSSAYLRVSPEHIMAVLGFPHLTLKDVKLDAGGTLQLVVEGVGLVEGASYHGIYRAPELQMYEPPAQPLSWPSLK